MTETPLEASLVEPSDNGGYRLSSCERYWAVAAVFPEQPGCLFFWDGTGWTDFLHDTLLYDDRTGADARADQASERAEQGSVIRAVNLADYLRFDRRMAGYPLHLGAGKARHRNQEEVLTELFRAMLAKAG